VSPRNSFLAALITLASTPIPAAPDVVALETSQEEGLGDADADGLWNGWTELGPAPAGDAAADLALLDPLEAAECPDAEDGRAALESARVVARRFSTWAATRLAPPEFSDAGDPAPTAWVSQQLPVSLREESRLLAEALDAPSSEDAARAARMLVRVRFRRVAMLRAADVGAWRRQELTRGLAAYTVWHLAAADGTACGEWLSSRLLDRLVGRLGSAAGEGASGLDPETSGFATALLLDRVQPGWREELVRRGTSLEVLLAGKPTDFGRPTDH
jgi:hypothetical protein